MKNHKRLVSSLWIILLTVTVLLLFSSTTSPLYPNNYGNDSAFNRFMGLMVRRGKVLYSEIWDNKGPVLFFISAIGTLTGTHNAPISLTFLMQITSVLLTMYFLCKAEQEANRTNKNTVWIMIASACAMSVLCVVIDSGNLSEEWCMPLIALSLYLMVKYTVNVKDSPLHPRRYAFIHGICFGLIAFIRINNGISICAGLLVIGIYLMVRKKWQNLLENILFGHLGFAVIALPICAYFLWKHAFSDMIYAVFFYNLKYASQRTHKTFSGTELLVRFLPMAISLFILFIHLIRTRTFRLPDVMMLLIISMNTVMLWRSNIFLHYYIIYVPVFLLTLFLYADLKKIPELFLSVLVLAFFISRDVPLLKDMYALREAPDRFAFAASIPEEEKGSAMGLYVSAEVYLNSGLIPCSRYAAYHFAHFPVDPDMKEEFLNDMRSAPPNWIIYLSGYEGIIPEMQQLLDEKYEWVTDEYGATYYRIKN